MARNYSSIVEPKTLNGNVTSIATQITLNNVTGLPSAPYVLVLNPDTASEEVVLVDADQSGVTSPTLKVTRAIETGATAKTHTSGDTVKHMIVGSDLQLVHSHLDNTTTAHNLNLKAPLASPTFTGTVTLPSTTSIGNVSATEIGYVDGVTSAIQTQLNTIVNTTIPAVIPVATIIMYGGTSAPTGWLLCDGQSTTGYAALAAVVGANVPDLRGRAPIGYGQGAGLTNRSTIGATTGTETHALTQSEMPRHNHGINPSQIYGTGSGGTGAYAPSGNNPQGSVTTFFTGGDGTDEASENALPHNNMQPSTVVNFIIKY